jgi:hypothetical protein
MIGWRKQAKRKGIMGRALLPEEAASDARHALNAALAMLDQAGLFAAGAHVARAIACLEEREPLREAPLEPFAHDAELNRNLESLLLR